jgi:endonuclease-3
VLSAQLPQDWDAQRIYDNHEVMMLHGQRCCYFRNPACGRCPLLDLCPTGQRRMAPGKAAGDNEGSDQALAVTAEVSLDRNSLARS